MKRVLAVFIVVFLGSGAACSTTNQQSVPPILRGVTAGSGFYGGCPPSNEATAESVRIAGKLAVSPEFNGRLEAAFPPGSPQAVLIDSLTAQGFVLSGQCKTDSTVKIALFHLDGRALSRLEMGAEVYWQARGRPNRVDERVCNVRRAVGLANIA
jgi:hypothetical protein